MHDSLEFGSGCYQAIRALDRVLLDIELFDASLLPIRLLPSYYEYLLLSFEYVELRNGILIVFSDLMVAFLTEFQEC